MRLCSSAGLPKLPVGQGSTCTLSKSEMPRSRIASCQAGSALRELMARIESSNNRAGRTSERTTHETISAAGSETTASMTVLSGPGTMTNRTRRSTGSPVR